MQAQFTPNIQASREKVLRDTPEQFACAFASRRPKSPNRAPLRPTFYAGITALNLNPRNALPSPEKVEAALRTHFDAWNEGNRSRWLANWDSSVVLEDPVGGPMKEGLGAVEQSWDNSFKEGHSWRLEPIFMSICEDQAAVHVRNHGVLDGNAVEMDSIEIYRIGDNGKIVRVQTYFSPPDGQALDPFFTQVKK